MCIWKYISSHVCVWPGASWRICFLKLFIYDPFLCVSVSLSKCCFDCTSRSPGCSASCGRLSVMVALSCLKCRLFFENGRGAKKNRMIKSHNLHISCPYFLFSSDIAKMFFYFCFNKKNETSLLWCQIYMFGLCWAFMLQGSKRETVHWHWVTVAYLMIL